MPPVIIAGVAAAAIGGAATYAASKSNSKAIKQSTQAQTDSTNAQIGYQREADAFNRAALSPWMASGLAANNLINGALGITTPAPAAPSAPTYGALTTPMGANPDSSANFGYNGTGFGPAMQNPVQEGWMGGQFGQSAAPQATQPQAPQQTPQQAALSAYDIFKQSTGYQSRLTEGYRGLNASFAGRGVLQSGAAVKSALRYGQDFASNEFGNWLSYLGNQQGLGFAGASALAGVTQGGADRMGAISQNAANNSSAAAIARAQNQGALYTGIAGALGTAAGSLSSYRAPTYRPALMNNVPAYGYG